MSQVKDINMLEVKKLSWGLKKKQILSNINFSVQQGEFIGIIGPNGSGKSSLLRCLYGHNSPFSGEVLFQQHPLQSYSRKSLARQIAVVLQEPPTQFDLQVVDVIRMGLIPHKKLFSINLKNEQNAIIGASNKVDLYDKLDHSFNSLSGGEKQRAMIARAILQQPKLLLMDEPTNHLDIHHQVEVLKLAQLIGMTVIVTLHDLNLAATFCDRLILLDEGEISAQGEPESVLTSSILQRVFKVNAFIDKQPYNQKLRVSFELGDPCK